MKPILETVFFVLACFASLADQASAEKPNIIYILADDLGYGDVQALNPEHSKIATPGMDRLAAAPWARTKRTMPKKSTLDEV